MCRHLLFSLSAILVLLATSCASNSMPPQPEWTKAPARVVDNGYIVYVESSEDMDADKAKFKSEAAALEDIANECSFIPKEARVEDRFAFKNDHMNVSYTKAAIEFQVCEQARKTNDPELIRKMANVSMTEEVKRYQELIGKPDVESVTNNEIEAPSSPGPGKTVSAPMRFYVIREQVWYEKERVILSPEAEYSPGTPARTAYEQRVQASTNAVENYVASHPEIKASPRPWSSYRTAAMRSSPARMEYKPHSNPAFHPMRQQKPEPEQQQPRKKKKRKRSW